MCQTRFGHFALASIGLRQANVTSWRILWKAISLLTIKIKTYKIIICDKVTALTIFFHVLHCSSIIFLYTSLFYRIIYCMFSFYYILPHHTFAHVFNPSIIKPASQHAWPLLESHYVWLLSSLIHGLNCKIDYLKQLQDDAIDFAEEHSKTGHFETVNCTGQELASSTLNWQALERLMEIGHRISLLERVSEWQPEWLVNDVNAPPDCHILPWLWGIR